MIGIGGCCARAASGQVAAPPSPVRNSRRRMLHARAADQQLSLTYRHLGSMGTGHSCHRITPLALALLPKRKNFAVFQRDGVFF